MPINFDSALGSLPQALAARAQRTEILASNMANAETPGYKARDFDFHAALKQAQSDRVELKTTRHGHISSNQSGGLPVDLQYRVPNQPSLDGNTVDTQLEQATFSKNALYYQATLTFLSGRFKGLKTAISGEP